MFFLSNCFPFLRVVLIEYIVIDWEGEVKSESYTRVTRHELWRHDIYAGVLQYSIAIMSLPKLRDAPQTLLLCRSA